MGEVLVGRLVWGGTLMSIFSLPVCLNFVKRGLDNRCLARTREGDTRILVLLNTRMIGS